MTFSPEEKVHGERWGTLHGGYFSDPAIAQPYLDVIIRAVSNQKPDLIADLGGAGGFILEKLSKRIEPSCPKLVNIENSARQIPQNKNLQITHLNMSAEEFTRRLIAKENENLMLIARSVLHYFGKDGLLPFLQHLRKQLNTGEIFIHQTACFEKEEDASLMNHLYRLMRTGKWYPTIAQLQDRLLRSGWEIIAQKSAAPLVLRSDELIERYDLTKKDTHKIIEEIGPGDPNLFNVQGESFTAFLYYQIFYCRAC